VKRIDLPTRTILKDRDSKPLIEELNKISGFEHLSRKSRVETEMVKNSEIIFVDGVPVAFKREAQFVPVLTNTVALEKMPRITVDMGAVPHVVGGADIMAPGIRRVEGSFDEKQLVVIVDEKHGKFLSIGSSLLGSEALAATKKGKVISNIHYVGDPVWETIKSHVVTHSGS
jgi:PUA-domain protein